MSTEVFSRKAKSGSSEGRERRLSLRRGEGPGLLLGLAQARLLSWEVGVALQSPRRHPYCPWVPPPLHSLKSPEGGDSGEASFSLPGPH